MRSTGSASKRGSVSASAQQLERPRRGARASVSELPREGVAARRRSTARSRSRRAGLEGPAVEVAGALVEQAGRACRRRPALPAGSCAEPPSKAKETAISGTVCSSTSQASMPSGLTTRWMRGGGDGSAVDEEQGQATTSGAATRRLDEDAAGSGAVLPGGSPTQVAGHRRRMSRYLRGGGLDLVDGDGVDRRRPGLHVLDGARRWSARCRSSGRARTGCPRRRSVAAIRRRLARASSSSLTPLGDQSATIAVDRRLERRRASTPAAARRRRRTRVVERGAVDSRPPAEAATASVDDELAVEPAGRAAAEDLGEHVERLGLARLAARDRTARGRRRCIEGCVDLRVGQRHGARRRAAPAPRRGTRAAARRGAAPCRRSRSASVRTSSSVTSPATIRMALLGV